MVKADVMVDWCGSWLNTAAVITTLLGVSLGVILYYLENSPSQTETWNIRMAEEAAGNREKFREMNKSAFILGYTGEVGKELVKEILTSGVFSRVVLIGRREVKFTDDLYANVEQKVIDFEKVDEHKEAFSGLDVGFCCLGTTRGKAGAEGFYHVDHDYVMNSAKVALEAGCSHFHLVSSTGADKKSMFLYPKTKGQVEDELSQMGFQRLSIYRPAMLMCDRQERRSGEAVFLTLLKPITYTFPTAISVPTSTVAKAMVNVAVSPISEKVELLDNKAIHQLSGDLGAKKKDKK